MNYDDAQPEFLEGGNVLTEECGEFGCGHGVAAVFDYDGLTGEGGDGGGDGDGVGGEITIGSRE